jgi:hypothetical protein
MFCPFFISIEFLEIPNGRGLGKGNTPTRHQQNTPGLLSANRTHDMITAKPTGGMRMGDGCASAKATTTPARMLRKKAGSNITGPSNILNTEPIAGSAYHILCPAEENYPLRSPFHKEQNNGA